LAIDLHSLFVFARCKDLIAADRAEAANRALPEYRDLSNSEGI
jgi:hypothetical protein